MSCLYIQEKECREDICVQVRSRPTIGRPTIRTRIEVHRRDFTCTFTKVHLSFEGWRGARARGAVFAWQLTLTLAECSYSLSHAADGLALLCGESWDPSVASRVMKSWHGMVDDTLNVSGTTKSDTLTRNISTNGNVPTTR